MSIGLKIFHKGLILVVLPLVIEILLICGLSILLHLAEAAKAKETTARRLTIVSARLLSLTGELPTLAYAKAYTHSDKMSRAFEKGKQQLKKTINEFDSLLAQVPEAHADKEAKEFPARMLALISRVALMAKENEDASIVFSERKSGMPPMSPEGLGMLFDGAVETANFEAFNKELTRAAREAFAVAGASGVRRLSKRVNECSHIWRAELTYELHGKELTFHHARHIPPWTVDTIAEMSEASRTKEHIFGDELSWYQDMDPPLQVSLEDLPGSPDGSPAKVTDKIEDEYQLSDELNAVVANGMDHLLSLLRQAEEHAGKLTQLQTVFRQSEGTILAAGVVSNILVGIFLMTFYRRQILQRLETISKNAIALSLNKPMSKPLSGDDEIALLDHSFHNMSQQLVEASERERALFQNASDVMAVLNDRHEFLKVNPACEQHWGYSSSELIGKPITLLAAPSDGDLLTRKLEEAVRKAEAVAFECNVKTKFTQERSTLWSAYWSGSEASLFCIAHDQTEQKNVEKSKSAFMSLMSSDLMLPLTAIASNLRKLSEPQANELSAEAKSRLNKAGRNVDRLVELVNDLLNVNRLESAAIELRKQSCRVADIIARVKDELEILASKKSIELAIKSIDDEWYVDGNRLIQVLVNLVSNAVKFSEPKSFITISAEKQGQFIVCRVQDQGRGIKESQKQVIFEKFKQAMDSDGRRSMGTGLGLPICKQIIEAHGGEIGVDSIEGKGSTFWFRLPVTEVALGGLSNVAQKPAAEPVQAVQPELDSIPVLPAATKKTWSHEIGLGYKGAILVGVPVICEVLLVCSLFFVLFQVDQASSKELLNVKVGNCACNLMIDCLDAEMRSMRRFKHMNINKQGMLEDMADAEKAMKELKNLVADDPQQLLPVLAAEQKLAALADSHYAKFHLHRRRSVQRRQPDYGNGIAGWQMREVRHEFDLITLLSNLRKVTDKVEAREFDNPSRQDDLRKKQGVILLLGLAANIIASIMLVALFSRDINLRLMILADNANRLSRDRDLNAVMGGSDEIAKLDEAFHAMARSLSQTRKKERAIFDNSNDIITVIDDRGKFLSINPACQRIWSYTQDELLIKDGLLEIVHPDDREVTGAALFQDSNARASLNLENRVLKANAEVVHTLWSISRDESGSMLFCIAHDITARKELENLKKEFLSIVSHDLRTPVSSILVITELIASEALGPVQSHDLELIRQVQQDCQNLTELIKDLLDLSKLEDGKMQFMFEKTDLTEIFRLAAQTGMSMESAVKVGEDCTVVADKERLAQALGNIILFAAGNSTGPVRIESVRSDDMIRVVIRDGGPALSQEDQLSLFQLHGVNMDEEKISGRVRLTLALARFIIEHHKGQISVSTSNGGNRYAVTIPRDCQAINA
jgi:PAS domain S-box-containing protein